MNLIKKAAGKILYGFAQVISKALDILISIIEFFVIIVKDIAKLLAGLVSMGGCLLLIVFGPLILFNPITLFTIVFLIIFPILGTKFISYIKYLKYMITEFLFDHANYLMHGQNKQFSSFSEYGDRYKKAEEAKRRKEQQQRQYQQQKEWEEKFRRWHEYQSHSQRTYQGNFNQQRQGHYYGNQQPFANPTIEFKKKFEESCDLLGVDYHADKYQVKLAYRKKAKEYHPDVNQSPGATKLFQEINNAYEFLSDDHIERYKNMN